MKINGREVVGEYFAYEGCHKMYVCKTEQDLHDLDESAYMEVTAWKGIYPTYYLEPQSDEAKEEWAQYEQKVEYRRMLERDQLSINFDIAM